ncbi:DUF3253 domain-containing protein [Leptolyngbya iicbica]|uniref:DUF3253 domain-containing protein n=2 Tax=Cyanophyceae TaxID=3028117 RepID=A0A4V2E1Z6_9CYAN|nr:DUF3253 domain-containing protein [Leptolyngbya sp. LK]RZM76081.1 DUF3253 domain-containing protein [Leptolyngbya sp. LK]
MALSEQQIQDCLMQLVRDRGPEKTICPSEVARALSADDWRSLMPQVRTVGMALAQAGAIAVTQKGQVVDPQTAKGPIRYRLLHHEQTDRRAQS